VFRLAVRTSAFGVQGSVCKLMAVNGYPSIFFGTSSQFLSAYNSGVERSGVYRMEHENAHGLDGIIADILKYFNLTDTSSDGHLLQLDTVRANDDGAQDPPGFNGPGELATADARDIVAATVQTYREIMSADGDLERQRSSFVSFWSLVRDAHPAQECRVGASRLLDSLPIWWPEDVPTGWSPPDGMMQLEICEGQEEDQDDGGQPYYSCKGSQPSTRGYTCGLWMLFHSLAIGYVSAFRLDLSCLTNQPSSVSGVARDHARSSRAPLSQ
jgi:thiol oxidase